MVQAERLDDHFKASCMKVGKKFKVRITRRKEGKLTTTNTDEYVTKKDAWIAAFKAVLIDELGWTEE